MAEQIYPKKINRRTYYYLQRTLREEAMRVVLALVAGCDNIIPASFFSEAGI